MLVCTKCWFSIGITYGLKSRFGKPGVGVEGVGGYLLLLGSEILISLRLRGFVVYLFSGLVVLAVGLTGRTVAAADCKCFARPAKAISGLEAQRHRDSSADTALSSHTWMQVLELP